MGIWELFCLIGWGMSNSETDKSRNVSNFWDWVGIWIFGYVAVIGFFVFLKTI